MSNEGKFFDEVIFELFMDDGGMWGIHDENLCVCGGGEDLPLPYLFKLLKRNIPLPVIVELLRDAGFKIEYEGKNNE